MEHTNGQESPLLQQTADVKEAAMVEGIILRVAGVQAADADIGL